MTEQDFFNFQLECLFEDNPRARLDRQLALLLSTREGSMPLDREFGINMDFVDRPPEIAKSLYAAEAAKKVAMFIPSVRVREVKWSHDKDGKLTHKVVITNA